MVKNFYMNQEKSGFLIHFSEDIEIRYCSKMKLLKKFKKTVHTDNILVRIIVYAN